MQTKIKTIIEYYDDANVLQWKEPRIDTYTAIPDIEDSIEGLTINLATAVDQKVDLAPIGEACMLYILTDNDITFTINADSQTAGITEFSVKADKLASGDIKQGVFLATTSGVTSLYFSNAGVAKVKIIVFSK